MENTCFFTRQEMSQCPVSSPVELLTSRPCHQLTSGWACVFVWVCVCCCQQCDAVWASGMCSRLCLFTCAIKFNHQQWSQDEEVQSIHCWLCVPAPACVSLVFVCVIERGRQSVYQLSVYVIRETIISFVTACAAWLWAGDNDDNNSNVASHEWLFCWWW